ncbi:MAG TPA: hypothetical protein DCE78_03175 [Bacteroidetes bacterium]|nr:hypothetical protein [Bacteroidota bacterium]
MKNSLISFLIIFLILFSLDVFSQKLFVKSGKNIIEAENAEPFLWIGDTAWDLFSDLNREESVFYLDNRKEKGFTVIQATLIMGGFNQPNVYGDAIFLDRDPIKPNEKFFEYVDFIVNEAAKRGIFMGLLPTWANNVVARDDGNANFNTENALAYGHYLGNRYKNKPVIWILGGDRNVQTDDEYVIWEAMATGIREGSSGNNLITYHPTAPISSHFWFHNEPWLSFNTIQSGHFKKFQTEIYEFGMVFQQLNPIKPWINSEPAYEDIPVLFWHYSDFKKYGKVKEDVIGEDGLIKDRNYFSDGFFDDYDVRMEAYWTFFSGGVGYTYGNNAIWQMYKPGTRYHVPCLTFWEEALDRPGADDMRHVSKLFTSYPLGSFHIDQSVIYGTNFLNESNIRAVVGNDRSFILLYLNKGQEVRVNMTKLIRNGTASWFNPREGSLEKIGKVENKGFQLFDPPGDAGMHGNDWILVLEAAQI